MLSDYTVLPLGAKYQGGVVKVCPKCKRRGLWVETSGHSFYTHLQFKSNDDPANVFVRRVECHLMADEVGATLRLGSSSPLPQR
jgi:hypothetical protein